MDGHDGETARDHLRDDPVLAGLIERHDRIELSPAADPFERLITSVIRQQLSMHAADAIQRRLESTVDIAPADLLDADRATLEGVGLSTQKITAVRHVARAFEERHYSRAQFEAMNDDEVTAELTSIHGVGPWTAKMFLIFCLARPDVFPVEDLGIRNAIRSHYDESMDRPEMVDLAARWRPYRSYASCYLWRGID